MLGGLFEALICYKIISLASVKLLCLLFILPIMRPKVLLLSVPVFWRRDDEQVPGQRKAVGKQQNILQPTDSSEPTMIMI